MAKSRFDAFFRCLSRASLLKFFGAWLLLLLLSGCYSTGISRVINEPAPVEGMARTNLGRMVLLPDPMTGDVDLRYPRSTSEAVIRELHRRGGLLFVGVVEGLFKGVPQSQIDSDAAQLKLALQEEPLLPGMIEHVQAGLQSLGHDRLPRVPEELAEPLLGRAPAERDYRPLSALGWDSVLELVVYRQAFRAEKKGNPPMSFETSIHVYVTRISDGELLFVQPFDYRTRRYLFGQWADEKARRFRTELEGLRRDAAAALLEQLFLPEKR